jgi:hypothetical protein
VKQSGESGTFISISIDGCSRMNSTATVDSPGEENATRAGAGREHPNVSAPPATADAGDGEPIPKDELFHLLQNSRRRAVLRYLRGREGPVRMRVVAEQVAAWEHDTTIDRLTAAERKRVYIALYQSHLDTLAEAGVIDYDKSRGVIEPNPLLDHVASYTDADPGPPDGRTGWSGETTGAEEANGSRTGEPSDESRMGGASDTGREGTSDGARPDEASDAGIDGWSQGYLGVSVVGSLLLFGTAMGLPVFQAVSGTAVGVFVLVAFSVLTLAKLALDDAGMGRGRSE